jgi:hypothetical protein
MDEQLGPRAVVENLRENLPQLREAMRRLPVVIHNLSEQAREGTLRVSMDAPELRSIEAQLQRQQRQRFRLAVGSVLLLCGTLVLTLGSISVAWLGWILLIAGGLGLFAGRPDGSHRVR